MRRRRDDLGGGSGRKGAPLAQNARRVGGQPCSMATNPTPTRQAGPTFRVNKFLFKLGKKIILTFSLIDSSLVGKFRITVIRRFPRKSSPARPLLHPPLGFCLNPGFAILVRFVFHLRLGGCGRLVQLFELINFFSSLKKF